MSMEKMVQRTAITRHIKYTARLSRLGFILLCFAALGVLGMHYLGMRAQRSNALMRFTADIVALSCIIALFTATAAFWILFRALTFWPNYESLRLASALIMGVAVCGTHYTGMGAATYEYQPLGEMYHGDSGYIVDGASAASLASHASILVCFWSSTFGVMVSLRTTARMLDRKAKKKVLHPDGARTSVGPPTIAANVTTRLATLRTMAPAWASQAPKLSEEPSDVHKASSKYASEAVQRL